MTSSRKVKGWELRQEDIGWGRALAHLIPLYPLIYGYKRYTWTPMLHTFFGTLAIGVVAGIASPNMPKDKANIYGTWMSVIATPLLAKRGIDQAREYAKLKLNQPDNS